jgi:hypothetical protein
VTGEYEQYLRSWIEEVLSVPHELMNSLPVCPFAKKAMLENKIEFIRTIDYVTDIKSKLAAWDDSIHAVVFVCDDECDPVTFAEDVREINKECMPNDFILLEDHVKIPEPFHGISFNNGRYNLIIAQRLQNINEASRYLCREGYYVNWSDELYDDVVRWRFEAGPSFS